MGSKQRLQRDDDGSTKLKTWQVHSFVKRTILRFDLKKSQRGFLSGGRGRSFHAEGEDGKGLGTNSGVRYEESAHIVQTIHNKELPLTRVWVNHS